MPGCGIDVSVAAVERIQRHLLAKSTFDFKKALEIAQGMEITAQPALDLLGSTK